MRGLWGGDERGWDSGDGGIPSTSDEKLTQHSRSIYFELLDSVLLEFSFQSWCRGFLKLTFNWGILIGKVHIVFRDFHEPEFDSCRYNHWFSLATLVEVIWGVGTTRNLLRYFWHYLNTLWLMFLLGWCCKLHHRIRWSSIAFAFDVGGTMIRPKI